MYTPYVTQISPGVTLTCVETNKFKTGSLTIHLLCPLTRETAALNAILPRVLRRGTASLPDMQRLAEALDDLYGASISPSVRKKGELHCVELVANFLDDNCVPPSDDGKPLEKTAALLGDLLLNPDLQNGLLRADYIDSERKKLIDDINAAINDKRGYSIDRLLEEMCSDEAYGVSSLGSEEEALKITPASLTEHYHKLLQQSRIEVTYCGAAESTLVESAVRNALRLLPPRNNIVIPSTNVRFFPPSDKPRVFTDTLDVTQGKLSIGFRLGEAMHNPNYHALMVFNAVYGGSITSKLFLNVREKLSLCYYASSMIEKHKGVLIVYSGVEFSKFDVALNEILAQLDCIKNGDVSEHELQASKNFLVTAVLSAMDRPFGLDDLFFDSSISAVKYSPNDLCELIERVSIKDIVNVAKGIKTDSIYYLTSKEAG